VCIWCFDYFVGPRTKFEGLWYAKSLEGTNSSTARNLPGSAQSPCERAYWIGKVGKG